MGTGAYESNHEYVSTHQNEYIWFITAIIHGYRCFISILTRLYFLNVPELAFWKADVDNMMFGRLFPLFPPSGKEHTFSISQVLFSFSLKNMWISGWISGNNIRVHMFYFDSNTTVPLQGVALVVCWQVVVWLTVSWDHNKISSRRLLN